MAKPPLPDDVWALLAKPNPAVMASVRADGQPVTVATWYAVDGDRVLINLDESRKRLDHLRHDGRVSLTALRADSSMPRISCRDRPGSRSCTSRAAEACTPTDAMWWAMTSCSSRAMRSRSSFTARSASCWAWSAMRWAWTLTTSPEYALDQLTRPRKMAPPKYIRFMKKL